MVNSKLYLIWFDGNRKARIVKYFDTEYEMDKFKRVLEHIPKVIIIEDSRDIYFFGSD